MKLIPTDTHTLIEHLYDSQFKGATEKASAKAPLMTKQQEEDFQRWSTKTPQEFLSLLGQAKLRKLLSSVENKHQPAGYPFLIQEMSQEEYKSLRLSYDIYETIYGKLLIASSTKGISLLIFVDEDLDLSKELSIRYPYATYTKQHTAIHQTAVNFINKEKPLSSPLTFHVWGTPFQLQVWKALLDIPAGELRTYGSICEAINSPKASRAVGTAVGRNPVSLLIPCHRVIRSSGVIGHYHWGKGRKILLLGMEQIGV